MFLQKLFILTLSVLALGVIWSADDVLANHHPDHVEGCAPGQCDDKDDDDNEKPKDENDEPQDDGDGEPQDEEVELPESEPEPEENDDSGNESEDGLEDLLQEQNPLDLVLGELPIENELKRILSNGSKKRYFLFHDNLLDEETDMPFQIWDGLLLLQDPSRMGVLTQELIEFPNGDTHIQWWYQNPDGSLSRLLGSPDGPYAGVATFWPDGKISFALDLDRDRTVDYLSLTLADFQELIFADDALGLSFLADLLLGINPLCELLAAGDAKQGGSYGDGAHAGTWVSGCRQQDDEDSDDEGDGQGAESGCTSGPSADGLAANDDEPPASSSAARDYNQCRDRCLEDGIICVAGCTGAGLVTTAVGTPLAGGTVALICDAGCSARFFACNNRCIEDYNDAAADAAARDSDTQASTNTDSDDDRYHDTDGDGQNDAEDTDGDGEPDASCNPCGDQGGNNDQNGNSGTQPDPNDTNSTGGCGINVMDIDCSDGPQTIEEMADYLRNGPWGNFREGENSLNRNGCGCGESNQNMPDGPGPGPDPGPDSPENAEGRLPCGLAMVPPNSHNEDAAGQNQSLPGLDRDTGGCFDHPGAHALPGEDGNCFGTFNLLSFGSILLAHSPGCEVISCTPAESRARQGG